MEKVLGIVTFEDETVSVRGLDDYRPIAAASFLGRYRVIDFVLSNFSNSGINEIQIYVKNQPRSIIGHLNGTNFNLNSKHGKIDVFYGEGKVPQDVYNHDINSFYANMQYIEESNKPYVIIAPSYMIYSFDFNHLLNHHIESGDDITMLYKKTILGKSKASLTTTLTIENNRVMDISRNLGKFEENNIFLGAYCMSRELFIKLVDKSIQTSSLYWLKNIVKDSLFELKVGVYEYSDYAACINSLESYFKASMELTKFEYADKLFKPDWPIYTMTNDSSPTLYDEGTLIQSSVVANGCQIHGTVINSIIGRNVVVQKGAIVENSVILPGTFIGADAKLKNCVVDRHAIINHIKRLKGTPEEPIYVKRRDKI
ncbi:MAG: glucose-1-phosphate adenylyltransferase subunit GlgD [Erysipelotrichaceae bacterium]